MIRHAIRAINDTFSFRKVRVSLGGQTCAIVDGDELSLTLNSSDPFVSDVRYVAMLAVRETYMALYGYDGVAAEVAANKSVIRSGMGDALAEYYYFLLTERKEKSVQDMEGLLFVWVPQLSFYGLDSGRAEMFGQLAGMFTFNEGLLENAGRALALLRKPHGNFEEIKKELGLRACGMK